MATDVSSSAPPVEWAQRGDKIYLTINLEDCSSPTLDIKPDKIYFHGKGGTEKKDHEVTINLFKEIIPEDSKYVVLSRNIPMVLKKKEEGPFWPRLLKESKKMHWLKTDFSKWRDEDDSDVDEKDDYNFEKMMGQMGDYKGPGGDAQGLPDSDDEDLPDLE